MINRVTTWVLIMALLISQSYAYASVPCESNGNVMSQNNHDMGMMVMMDHSLPEHDTQQQEFVMDCCDEECSCPAGTYSSVTLTHFITASALRLVSAPSSFILVLIQDAFLPSLRKPPIFG
jgi:hypothetical protein